MSQPSVDRPMKYHIVWAAVRTRDCRGSSETMEGPIFNTNNENMKAPLRKILAHHHFTDGVQADILRIVYAGKQDVLKFERSKGSAKTITVRPEYNEEVAKAAMSATAEQPLEIWTVFQPKPYVHSNNQECDFSGEDGIESFVKSGGNNFSIGYLCETRRPASFLRKDDAVAYARNVLRKEVEVGRIGSGVHSQEYESEPGQGITHGVVKDRDGNGIRLVTIVKSVVPVADT